VFGIVVFNEEWIRLELRLPGIEATLKNLDDLILVSEIGIVVYLGTFGPSHWDEIGTIVVYLETERSEIRRVLSIGIA
jgi:hypothetical protein